MLHMNVGQREQKKKIVRRHSLYINMNEDIFQKTNTIIYFYKYSQPKTFLFFSRIPYEVPLSHDSTWHVLI